MAGYTVQVKRLRNQDPLEALVFRGTKRRREDDEVEIEDPDFVFRLADTFNTQQKHVVLQRFDLKSKDNMLRVAGPTKSRKTKDTSDDVELPSQLQDMISEYMETENIEKRELNLPDIDDVDKETEDYVYDVYYTERAGPLTGSNIGYIEADEKERKLIFSHADSDDDSDFVYDEDDSNAEDYYKNDYPEEEDDESDQLSVFSDDLYNVDSEVPDTGEVWSEADEDSYDRYGW